VACRLPWLDRSPESCILDKSFSRPPPPPVRRVKRLSLPPDDGQGVPVGWLEKGRGAIGGGCQYGSTPRFLSRGGTALLVNVTKSIACAPIPLSRTGHQAFWKPSTPTKAHLIQTPCLYSRNWQPGRHSHPRHAQLFERLQSAHQRYRELFDDSIDPILITRLGRSYPGQRTGKRSYHRH